MSNPELQPRGNERLTETTEAAEKQAELLKTLEKNETIDNAAERADDARQEAEALFSKESGSENKTGGEPSLGHVAAIRKITVNEKKRAFKQTLARAQSDMSPTGRVFSKIIHSPVVERSSEVVGSTLARPNAILLGSLTAFVLLSVIYLLATRYGYRLKGSEMIATFTLGWVIGLLIDYIRVMASGKRSS